MLAILVAQLSLKSRIKIKRHNQLGLNMIITNKIHYWLNSVNEGRGSTLKSMPRHIFHALFFLFHFLQVIVERESTEKTNENSSHHQSAGRNGKNNARFVRLCWWRWGGAAVAEELAGRSWVERWKATTVQNKTDAMAVPGNTLCNQLFAKVNKGGPQHVKGGPNFKWKGIQKMPSETDQRPCLDLVNS